MERSPQEQIDFIVRCIEEKRVPIPMEETMALARSHPDAIYDLAIAVMERFPEGCTSFDAALSFLPKNLWPPLTERAVEILEEAEAENEAATSLIAYASLQCPTSLHPHLTRIFALRPNAGSFYESYPWRESGTLHFDYLRDVFETTDSDEDRLRAWEAMLQTRNMEAIDFAVFHFDSVFSPEDGYSPEEWLQSYLHLVGFSREDGLLTRKCRNALYHLQFPESYFENEFDPLWLEKIHPTWNLPSVNPRCLFRW